MIKEIRTEYKKIIKKYWPVIIIFKVAFKIIIILSLLFSVDLKADENIDQDKMIRELLEESGTPQQIEAIPNVVRGLIPLQMAAQGVRSDAQVAGFFQSAFDKYFLVDDMLKIVGAEFKKNNVQNYAEKCLTWMKSDLGKKITEMEIEGSKPEAAFGLLAYTMQIQDSPVDEDRKELAKAMVKVLDISERGVKKSEVIFKKMAEGINKGLPKKRKLPPATINMITEQVKNSVNRQIEPVMVTSVLYIYKDLSDDEMEEYIEFLKTPHGQWFNNNILEGLLKAMEGEAEKIGLALGKKIARIKLPKKQKFKWKKYTSDDKSFSIEFPGKYVFKKTELATDDKPMILNMLICEMDEMAFMLSWIKDYPPLMEKEIDHNQILTNAAWGSVNSVGGHLIEKNFIKMKGSPGLKFKVGIFGGTGLIESQLFLINKNFYQVMVNGNIRDMLSDKKNNFFQSFNVK
ncbi:MAG: hypothetical protein JW827_03180 [Spirochaetes bacterium]|nr:hypothetical protein [Spirochaetota bacterium]